MTYLDCLLSFSSSLFRLASFVFLRIVPSPIFKTTLPILFVTYAALLLLTSKSVPQALNASDHPSRQKTNLANDPLRRKSNLLASVYTFVFTLPSPSVALRRLSLAANAVLLLFVADFITNPIRHPAHGVVFARIGAVDHNSAKLSVRYPGNDPAGNFSVRVLVRPSMVNASKWKDGPIIELLKQDDWVGTTVISNLWPSTAYDYKLAYPNSTIDLPYPSTPLQFKTFPDPRLGTGSHFVFIASSCLLPNFPYVPGKSGQIKGFDLMAEDLYSEEGSNAKANISSALQSSSSNRSDAILPASVSLATKASLTKFLLLLGDFIYADVPAYAGNTVEAYRRLYRRVYASPSFRKIYERLPTLHIYDDHEIINNFVGQGDDSTPPFPNASGAFDLYNSRGNYDSRYKGQYHYDFRHGDVAFFVLDTRRYRSKVLETDEYHATMLGNQQLQALQTWLAEVNETTTFKFIVSSVPFTSLWQHDAQTDSWAAYRRERAILLDILHTVPNLFILSGDRHEFAAIEYNGPYDWSHEIYEFSTSPISMFYVPFIRTLKMESSETVERSHPQPNATSHTQDTSQVSSPEKYLLPKEHVVKYLPVGNYKWTYFEIDTRNASEPTISAEVMINGQSAYRWSKVGSPAPIRRSTSLSLFIPQSLHDVLGMFGLEYRKWF